MLLIIQLLFVRTERPRVLLIIQLLFVRTERPRVLLIIQLLLKALTTPLVLRAPDHPAAVCTRPTIISYRIIIYRVRVSTPSTQNPDERARSDRAHATPGRVGAA